MVYRRSVTRRDARHEIVHATPGLDTAWNIQVVAVDDDSLASGCDAQPTMPGQRCRYEFTHYRPVAMVASGGGDVRFFIQRRYESGERESQCGVPQNCQWQTIGTPTRESILEVAWPESRGGFQRTVLMPGLFIGGRATAVVDAQGLIHLAVYSEGPNGSQEVRHLIVGPGR